LESFPFRDGAVEQQSEPISPKRRSQGHKTFKRLFPWKDWQSGQGRGQESWSDQQMRAVLACTHPLPMFVLFWSCNAIGMTRLVLCREWFFGGWQWRRAKNFWNAWSR
jgi:hypothetical protein